MKESDVSRMLTHPFRRDKLEFKIEYNNFIMQIE